MYTWAIIVYAVIAVLIGVSMILFIMNLFGYISSVREYKQRNTFHLVKEDKKDNQD